MPATDENRHVRPLSKILMVIVIVAVLLHALRVLTVNLPPNHRALYLIWLSRLDNGPWVTQSWSLFAPDPSSFNQHVLIRAKFDDGTLSVWRDASLYFSAIIQRNSFAPVHNLSMGLLHAGNLATSHSPMNRLAGDSVLISTSAMLMKLYEPNRKIVKLRVRVIRSQIAPLDTRERPLEDTSIDTGWVGFPKVESL